MNVLDLVKELLEFDVNADIELYVESDELDDDFEFGIEEYQSYKGETRVAFNVHLDNYVMVDKGEYEDLKSTYEEVQSEIEELRSELEGL